MIWLPNIQLHFHCKNYRIQKYTIITALYVVDVRKVDTTAEFAGFANTEYITLRIA
jgi:hypothetical protein